MLTAGVQKECKGSGGETEMEDPRAMSLFTRLLEHLINVFKLKHLADKESSATGRCRELHLVYISYFIPLMKDPGLCNSPIRLCVGGCTGKMAALGIETHTQHSSPSYIATLHKSYRKPPESAINPSYCKVTCLQAGSTATYSSVCLCMCVCV